MPKKTRPPIEDADATEVAAARRAELEDRRPAPSEGTGETAPGVPSRRHNGPGELDGPSSGPKADAIGGSFPRESAAFDAALRKTRERRTACVDCSAWPHLETCQWYGAGFTTIAGRYLACRECGFVTNLERLGTITTDEAHAVGCSQTRPARELVPFPGPELGSLHEIYAHDPCRLLLDSASAGVVPGWACGACQAELGAGTYNAATRAECKRCGHPCCIDRTAAIEQAAPYVQKTIAIPLSKQQARELDRVLRLAQKRGRR